VGNDIVDLKAPEAQGKAADERFLERVLAPAERDRIAPAGLSDRMLWAFWAAKEAAYKAVCRSRPGISAAPARYEVSFCPGAPEELLSGYVDTPGERVDVALFFHEDFLHCLAAEGSLLHSGLLVSKSERLFDSRADLSSISPEFQSRRVREMAASGLSRRLGIAARDIQIRRFRSPRGLGPPAVYIRGGRSPHEISLSHHGRFAGYAAAICPGAAAA
jgi:phosphopantetheine--protein transferase-like protein